MPNLFDWRVALLTVPFWLPSGCLTLTGCGKDVSIQDKILLMKASADMADQLDADFNASIEVNDSPSVGMKQDFYLHHGISVQATVSAEGNRAAANAENQSSSPAGADTPATESDSAPATTSTGLSEADREWIADEIEDAVSAGGSQPTP